MADEAQRRAFALYMGTSNVGQGQSASQYQYPGSVGSPNSPYLLNQFPGLGAPLAAPTPPPAAPSSVASFPEYQGGFLQAGLGQGAYSQVPYQGMNSQGGLPQRPPPLGQAESNNAQPLMPDQGGLSAYGHAARNFSTQPPPPTGYNAGWQYPAPNSDLARRLSGAPQGAMVPAMRSAPGNMVESRSRQTSEQYHYQQYGQQPGPPASQGPAPRIEEVSVPVMLCHTCSHCGRMRSAGFHRNNPVLPGKHLVLTPCRRCVKRIKNRRHSSFTRIRSCTADQPCDWPREPVHKNIDHGERRGRQRSREDVYVARYSPNRPRIVSRSSSQAHLGLRALEQQPREFRSEMKVRVSSLSPQRASRYGEIWPPPDVHPRASRLGEVYSAPPDPLPNRLSRADEVWPPPDVVRTHSYRKVERSPLHCTSSRIIELSPSPPPARTSSTRVVYRSESQARRPKSQSISPVRASYREPESGDAATRITAHARPYRSVLPVRTTFLRASDETSSNTESTSRDRLESPSRSILKPTGMDRESSYRRRASVRDSQESTHVEVGGPRVHFGEEQRVEGPSLEDRRRTRYTDDRQSMGKEYEHFREYSRHRHVDEGQPAPSVREFERMRVRHSSLSPQRELQEELQIDRARRISPSPPPTRRYEEIRVRHRSPPHPQRCQPPSPPPREQQPYHGYRHVSRTRQIDRARSLTPPSSRRTERLEDVTDSDSAHSGEVTEVRSWRGIDENGQPATFVEEKRTVRMIEQGNERGGEFRPMTDRLVARNWRDV